MERGGESLSSVQKNVGSFNLLHEVVVAWQSPDLLIYEKEGIKWQLKKPIIEFKNVSKVFEDSNTKVLKDINFELEEGKFYTLLGASGSGKSTILNIIAGLLDATTGDILLDGVRINDIPTNKRDVHTVFQSYALFPHMNVFENVAFPLRLRKIDKKEIEQRVTEVLKMVQLEGYEKTFHS